MIVGRPVVDFAPREFWIGARSQRKGFLLDLTVCPLPMLRFRFVILRQWKGKADANVYAGPSAAARAAVDRGERTQITVPVE